MKITVTQQDIDLSKAMFYNNCRHGPCPIERAFLREGIQATVGISIMNISGEFPDKYGFKRPFIQMMTPKEFGNFVYDFDHGDKRNCKPFSFEFEMPE
jgi:hypothetical protein